MTLEYKLCIRLIMGKKDEAGMKVAPSAAT